MAGQSHHKSSLSLYEKIRKMSVFDPHHNRPEGKYRCDSPSAFMKENPHKSSNFIWKSFLYAFAVSKYKSQIFTNFRGFLSCLHIYVLALRRFLSVNLAHSARSNSSTIMSVLAFIFKTAFRET